MAVMQHDSTLPAFATRYMNLADARLGAKTIFSTDDFFAPMERMLNPEPAIFIPGKYDDHGKWMDGWESRRKRTTGYDSCVVQLARKGRIRGVNIDTSHFTGNFPPAASLEGCICEEGIPTAQTKWIELLPSVNLQGNSQHFHEITEEGLFTHVRLNIYPDGGVARLRVYGQCVPEWEGKDQQTLYDLASIENGSHIVAANNQHFGLASNLLMPGRGINMGDGWETRRRREPGNDWCIIALAHAGIIKKIEVDTCHFKGNYPDRCSIQGAYIQGGTETSLITQSMFWNEILAEQPLKMDNQHFYEPELMAHSKITHIRFNIYPDGGVSRLRLWGHLA